MAAPSRSASATRGVGWEVLHFVGYIFPFLLTLGGAVVSAMQYRVFDPVPVEEQRFLLLAVLIQLLAAIIWIVIDFLVISNDRTTGTQLKVNVFVSSTINNIMLLLAGGMLFAGEMRWWMVVPTIAVIVDDYIVSNRAIVNALQKPIIQQGQTA
jgi:hypothetical protein